MSRLKVLFIEISKAKPKGSKMQIDNEWGLEDRRVEFGERSQRTETKTMTSEFYAPCPRSKMRRHVWPWFQACCLDQIFTDFFTRFCHFCPNRARRWPVENGETQVAQGVASGLSFSDLTLEALEWITTTKMAASMVEVLCPTGHRQKVKITPNMAILQVPRWHHYNSIYTCCIITNITNAWWIMLDMLWITRKNTLASDGGRYMGFWAHLDRHRSDLALHKLVHWKLLVSAEISDALDTQP